MLHFTVQWLLSLEILEVHFVCTLSTLLLLVVRHFPSAHTKVKDHNTLYTSGFNLCNVGHQSWNHNGLHYLSFRFTTLIEALCSQHFKNHIRRRTSCPRWLLCVLMIFATTYFVFLLNYKQPEEQCSDTWVELTDFIISHLTKTNHLRRYVGPLPMWNSKQNSTTNSFHWFLENVLSWEHTCVVIMTILRICTPSFQGRCRLARYFSQGLMK